MTRQEVINTIEAKATKYGFNFRKNNFATLGFEIVADEHVVNINLHEDWELKCEEKQVIHHIKVTASISQMGGNPTPQELLAQAKLIERAAKLYEDFENSDLFWVEQY